MNAADASGLPFQANWAMEESAGLWVPRSACFYTMKQYLN